MNRIVFVFLILIGVAINANASSVFLLKSLDNVFVAKNYESNNGVGYLIVNPRGDKSVALSWEHPLFSWVSKYGSITFNQLSKEMPIGGINEKGLVVEMIRSAEMSEQSGDLDIKLNEFEAVRYLLDNFENTSQAVEALRSIKIDVLSEKVHYFIADKFSKSAIVEYRNGRVEVIDDHLVGYIPILTENRFLKSLGAAKGAKSRVNIGDKKFTYLYNRVDTISNISSGSIFDIMQNAQSDNSKWNIVYDVKGEKIFFSTHSSPVVKEIDIAKINFNRKAQYYIDINRLMAPKCNGELSLITPQSHLNLVMNGFEGSTIAHFDNKAKRSLVYENINTLREVMKKRDSLLGTLKVSISNLDSDRGVVRFFLYDSQSGFSDGEYIRSEIAHTQNETAVAHFYNLPKNRNYALYYYHDENTNNRTDRQWVGLPKEEFGYSGKNGRSFNNAKFEFGDSARMHYEIEVTRFFFW